MGEYSRNVLLSIVVPAYNEAENIEPLVYRIDDVLKGVGYEVIIVNDGSFDGTSDIARSMASKGYPVRVLDKDVNMGKPSAIIDGVRIARGSYIAFLDADLEYPPEILREMLKSIDSGCAVVVGYRRDYRSLRRRIISWGARFLAKLLFPKVRGVRDPTSELLLARRDLLDNATIKTYYIKPYLPILLKTSRGFLCSIEVPLAIKNGDGRFRLKWVFQYIAELADLMKYTVAKLVIVSILAAVLANIASPYIGFYSILASLGFRVAFLFNTIGPVGVILSELASLTIKSVAIPILGIAGWVASAFVELLVAISTRSS